MCISQLKPRVGEKKIHWQIAKTLAAYRLRGLVDYVNSRDKNYGDNHLFLFYLNKTAATYQQFVLLSPPP